MCVVLLTIWIAGWAKLREYHSLSQKLEILTREHRPSHAMLQELVSMRDALAGLRHQETVANELEQQRHLLTLLGVVSQTARQSNGKLRVTTLKLIDFQGSSTTGRGVAVGSESSSLVLSGESLDNPSVAELLDGLQESRLFAQVKLISLKEREYNGVAFQDYELRCEF